MDGLVLHGLHGNSTVQCQRAGNDAAGHTALRDLFSGNGGGHLLGDVLHGGQNRHLGALDPQRVSHRQRVFHNADLGIHIGGDVDGGIGDHHEAALILEDAALAHQALAAGRDQSRLSVQNGAGKVGGLENTLHGDIRLALAHQLHRQLCGVQLLAIEIHDLIVLLALAHLMQHGDDLILFTYQRTLDNALAAGVDHRAQRRFIVGIGQRDALLHAAAQHIGFQFFKRCKHFLLPPFLAPISPETIF